MGRQATGRRAEAAADEKAHLARALGGSLVVAVNVSATQLRDGELGRWLLNLCQSMNVPPHRLELHHPPHR